MFAVMLFKTADSANAQTVDEWRATEGEQPKSEQKTPGGYAGVTPGKGNNLPRVEELRGKPGTWVTWPGFMMLSNGGSRLFLQTTADIDYKIINNGRKLVLKLNNTKVYLSNNRNPLITTHFNTPIKQAYIKKKGKGLELHVLLKKDVKGEISQNTDQDGYQYLFIDYPAGDYLQNVTKPTESSSEAPPASDLY
jgi:hypothetical protein